MNQNIIRVMPRNAAYGVFGNPARTEAFYDLSGLPWDKRGEVIKELEAQGYFVQQIWMDDLMPIQVGIEIRRKQIEEQSKDGGKP